jgi:pyruvate/2-oxoglutarate dehydrogenase complex dihydrolipoamide acyltransferase (E2) component
MGEIAFTVRDGYEGFEGGALAVGDGPAYHLGEELVAGNGYVMVADSDSVLAGRLREQPALVEVEVAAAKAAAKKIDDLGLDALKARATELHIDLDKVKGTGANGRVVKDDIAAAIRAAEEEVS